MRLASISQILEPSPQGLISGLLYGFSDFKMKFPIYQFIQDYLAWIWMRIQKGFDCIVQNSVH
jgi:hypothetical protein